MPPSRGFAPVHGRVGLNTQGGASLHKSHPWRGFPSRRLGLFVSGVRLRSRSCSRRERLIFEAKKKEDRYPFDRELENDRFPRDEGLPLSLFTPYGELPPEGKTLTRHQETCDPMEQRCQTPTHVYEARCNMCKGTGEMDSKSKGKRMRYTCPLCNGLGFVRRTTTRFVPDVNCIGPNYTINRQDLENGLPPHLRNGHKKEKE